MSPRGPVLVLGFGPFPGMPANPSAGLARRLGRMRRPALADVRLCVEILPTTWQAVAQAPDLIARLRPSAILMLGVAGRRRKVCVEIQAVNAAADAPDARRCHPSGRAMMTGAPRVLRSSANAPRLRAALHRVPAALSRDAGRYLCNALYFQMLRTLAIEPTPVPAVFVHIPRGPRHGRPAFEQRLTSAMGDLLVALAAQRPTGPAASPQEGAAHP